MRYDRANKAAILEEMLFERKSGSVSDAMSFTQNS